ncbi:MAG: type II secretion system minor pseudopilin GspH [Pseudomonadota bacterium]
MRRPQFSFLSRRRGFTLIELLVVVSVIGIIVSVVLLSVGVLGDDRDLRTEARRMAALVSTAHDEALLQGREYGIEFLQSSYRFVEFDPFELRWVELYDDDQYRMRQLPNDYEFELFLEDQIVLLDLDPILLDVDEDEEQRNRVNGLDAYQPHVLVYSSGDMTPFELHIVDRVNDFRVGVTADFAGTLELVTEFE